MTKIIITTVGTSLFTNYLYNTEKKLSESEKETLSIEKEFKEIANLINKDFNYENSNIKHIDEVISQNLDKSFDPKASAEISSILSIKNEYKGEDLKLYFVATDTVQSRLSSEITAKYFGKQKAYKVEQVKSIQGLQVKNYKEFKENGLLNLTHEISDIIRNAKNTQVIINLTGGFKGIIPIMTILAQLYGCEIKYIYEQSSDLITIPVLPIQFDWSKAEKYYYYLAYNPKNPKELKEFNSDEEEIINELVKSGLVLKVEDNKYSITSIGSMFFDYIHNNMDISNNALGIFIEYKLFEHYYKKPYKEIYSKIERSMKISKDKSKEGNELDLVFTSTENKSDYIVLESKSLAALNFYSEKTISEIKSQLEKIKENIDNGNFDSFPKEYILSVYIDEDKTKEIEYYKNKFESILLEIKEVVKSASLDTKFIFAPYFIKLEKPTSKQGKNQKNPYKEFLSNKLEEITYFEI